MKSPLHNFPLTFLKWGSKKDQQRCRRPPFDTSLSPPQQPPPHDAAGPSNYKPVGGSRSSRNRRNNNYNNNNNSNNHHLPTTTARREEEAEEERDCGKKAEELTEEGEGDGEKGWNLRPRRASAMKGNNLSTTATTTTNISNNTATAVETAGDNLPKSMRLRGLDAQGNGGVCGGGGGSEKREKKRFWIALSRDEIEEDIYSLTGSKPSRRPKKRPKNVQKQIDNVFPGLWMIGVSPETYRGLDSHQRGR